MLALACAMTIDFDYFSHHSRKYDYYYLVILGWFLSLIFFTRLFNVLSLAQLPVIMSMALSTD